jgi:hypothetical protein
VVFLIFDPDTRLLSGLAAFVVDGTDPHAQRLRYLTVRSGLDRVNFRAEVVVVEVTLGHQYTRDR